MLGLQLIHVNKMGPWYEEYLPTPSSRWRIRSIAAGTPTNFLFVLFVALTSLQISVDVVGKGAFVREEVFISTTLRDATVLEDHDHVCLAEKRYGVRRQDASLESTHMKSGSHVVFRLFHTHLAQP